MPCIPLALAWMKMRENNPVVHVSVWKESNACVTRAMRVTWQACQALPEPPPHESLFHTSSSNSSSNSLSSQMNLQPTSYSAVLSLLPEVLCILENLEGGKPPSSCEAVTRSRAVWGARSDKASQPGRGRKFIGGTQKEIWIRRSHCSIVVWRTLV